MSFFHEAKRRHHITCVILLISVIFAIIAIATPGWISTSSLKVGKLPQWGFGSSVCCPKDAPWYFAFNSALLIIAIIVTCLYLLYLIFTMSRCECECPAHMVRTDVSVCAFVTVLYIIVAICWPIASIIDLNSPKREFQSLRQTAEGRIYYPGYSYYLELIACFLSIGSTVASCVFLKIHGH